MYAVVDHLSSSLVLFIVLVIISAVYVRYCYEYWKRKNVPSLDVKFLYGNRESLLPKGIFVGALSKKLYDQFRAQGHDKIGGVYIGFQPTIVMLKPEWIKDILVKDFTSFTDRGIYMNENDPVNVHLFTQPGIQWKNTRIKFTPVFTSAKMKAMFETMLDCSEGLKEALVKLEAQRDDMDVQKITSCFTSDVIGSCAFGIECNSFKYPDAEFCTMGRKFLTEFTLMDRLNILLTIFAPKLAKRLGARLIQKEISSFFSRTITDMVNYREKNKVKRNDMMQLLIDMKNSDAGLSMKEIIGQVFLFFLAGFETSSTTSTMALFEISKDEDVQNKLRAEILDVLKRHDGKVTYNAISEMKYLGQIIDESLRLWTPLTTLHRECIKAYTFQDSNITVEKGTPILIPVLGLHHDPEYWKDPLKFDPERFSEENKTNIRPFTYLPFGEGPRNCIGLRFGLLQTKITLVTILSQYKVTLSPKTITPLGIELDTSLLVTKNKVYLRLEKI